MPDTPNTMRNIARVARVSVATVSKCLSNKADVSAATRERVLRVCRELGYRPNPLVAALMQARRRNASPASHLTLAFVTAFPSANEWKQHPSPIFRQMFAGALARATERNYKLEHFWLYQDGMSNQRFGKMLFARGIPGLLLAPIPSTRITVDISWSAFSVVVLGLTPSTRQFHRVSTDYYQGMLLALEECARLGYRRPGFAVRRETTERLEHRWEAAYLFSQRRNPAKRPPKPLVVSEWTRDAVLDWIEHERPDVIIGPVLGKLESIIRESGRSVPGDIGMVGLLVPGEGDRLSGIIQDGEMVGAVAVDQLISQIERNEKGVPAHPITHTMPGHWNHGATARFTESPKRSRSIRPGVIPTTSPPA
ncbi:LacI family transcriptional regulator [Termitidicoccus mucosus]